MNTTQLHRPPLEATAPYRPAAELVPGSAPVGEDELVPLLHKRLRFLVLVFASYYAVITVLLEVQSDGRPQARDVGAPSPLAAGNPCRA